MVNKKDINWTTQLLRHHITGTASRKNTYSIDKLQRLSLIMPLTVRMYVYRLLRIHTMPKLAKSTQDKAKHRCVTSLCLPGKPHIRIQKSLRTQSCTDTTWWRESAWPDAKSVPLFPNEHSCDVEGKPSAWLVYVAFKTAPLKFRVNRQRLGTAKNCLAQRSWVKLAGQQHAVQAVSLQGFCKCNSCGRYAAWASQRIGAWRQDASMHFK